MSEITKRLLTDDTGQEIVGALEDLALAVKPTGAEIDMSSTDTTKIKDAIETNSQAIAKKVNMDVLTSQSGLNTFITGLLTDRTAVCAASGDVMNALVGVNSYGLLTIVRTSSTNANIQYAMSGSERIGSLVYNFSTSTVTHLNDLNSKIENKTGSCTSSYGTIEYVRTGNVVQLTIACTGIASNAWTTISSDVPKAKKNCAFVGSDQSAGGNVALSITGTSLAFYGRGQYTTCNCSILYIAE